MTQAKIKGFIQMISIKEDMKMGNSLSGSRQEFWKVRMRLGHDTSLWFGSGASFALTAMKLGGF